MALNLEKLWMIIQGLPLNSGVVSAEILVAYNSVLTEILRSHNIPSHSALDQLYATVHRVHEFLVGDEVSGHSKTTQPTGLATCCDIIRQCLIKVESESDLTVPLCSLALVVSLVAAHQGMLSQAKQLLLQISTCLHENQTNAEPVEARFTDNTKKLLLSPGVSEAGFLSPGVSEAGLSEDSVPLPAIVKLISGLISVTESDFKSCSQHVSDVTLWHDSNIKPYFIYIQALSYYKEGQMKEARECLEQWRGFSATTSSYSSPLWNLCACVLALQKKPHSAIQLYKESLQADFDNILPMYNTALQYRELNRDDTELETLHLMYTALRQKENRTKAFVGKLPPSLSAGCGSLQFNVRDSYTEDISTDEALYALANRCLHLKRYDIGAEKYLELLSRLSLGSSISCTNFRGIIPMPSISQIFLECAVCQLHAKIYKECIAVCDKLIDTHKTSESSDGMNASGVSPEGNKTTHDLTSQPEDKKIKDSSIISSKKRLHSNDSDIESNTMQQGQGAANFDQFSPNLRALLVKADAQMMLNQPLDALKCLDRLIEKLQNFGIIEEGDQKETPIKPKRKRIRFELDEVDFSKDTGDLCKSSPLGLLCECHSKRAVLLTGLNRPSEAVASSRTAVLLDTNNLWLMYNHCLLLHQLRRHTEAANTWLDHRGIIGPLDSFQISSLLQKKTLAYQRFEPTGGHVLPGLHEKDILALDIVSLKSIGRNKHFVKALV